LGVVDQLGGNIHVETLSAHLDAELLERRVVGYLKLRADVRALSGIEAPVAERLAVREDAAALIRGRDVTGAERTGRLPSFVKYSMR
jgi:hypothetical protein